MSVCLFVCQQVACDVVTVYSRSESPCHVSLSQSNRYRSFARPVDRSVTIPRSVSRSVYLCLSVPVYKEQHTRPRPRALTSAVRSSALSTSSLISSFHPLDLSRVHTAYPRSRDIIHTSRSRREDCLANSRTVARPLDRTCACKTPDERILEHAREFTMLGERKVVTEEDRESGTERRTMRRRPTWVPRTKLTRSYVNCPISHPPFLVYIQI